MKVIFEILAKILEYFSFVQEEAKSENTWIYTLFDSLNLLENGCLTAAFLENIISALNIYN